MRGANVGAHRIAGLLEFAAVKLTPWMLSLTGFCIVLALTGGFVLKQMRAESLKPRQETEQPAQFASMETVPVALSDILPGTRIEAGYLTEAPILSSKVRKHRDTVRSAKALVGRIAKQKISVATPIRLSMFYPVNRKPEIRIPPGQRLVSVTVEQQSGFLNGLIQSGSYVDVFATIDTTSTGKDSEVVQLFEGVRVYEVFSSADVAVNRNEAVLELDSDQQKVMLLAKERGRISLTYNPEGPGTAGLATDSLASRAMLHESGLRTKSPAPDHDSVAQQAPEAAPAFVTEQFRDGIRSNAMYDNAGARMQPSFREQRTSRSSDQSARQITEAQPISWLQSSNGPSRDSVLR